MALSHEDKKDVAGAMGKALANKVSKVTRDSASNINRERKRQGYKPMSAERTRIHQGMDAYL